MRGQETNSGRSSWLEANRRADNAQAQIKYMCEEIAKALGLPVSSPADTVDLVRHLMAYAERRDAREAPAAEPGDEARRVAGAFMDEMLEICARAEGFDSYAACDWSPEGLMEWRDRLAALLASPAAERITPDALDGLDAVIEGEAVAFMEAWKAARFQHAGDFARQLAVRVVEVMREDTPTPAPTLADGETCDACGHVGRLHYRDPKRARTHGCMARVDSAYTVSNDRACGCHRRRVSEVQPTTSPEAEP